MCANLDLLKWDWGYAYIAITIRDQVIYENLHNKCLLFGTNENFAVTDKSLFHETHLHILIEPIKFASTDLQRDTCTTAKLNIYD